MSNPSSFAKEIFQIAIDKKASDVHLLTDSSPLLRVDGELILLEDKKPINAKEMEQIIGSLISNEDKEIFLKTKDLDFSYAHNDKSRFRVNIHFEKGNMGLVARLINDRIPSLNDIALPAAVNAILKLKQGLILVTGPTGCGKSTTLASMVDYLNENHRYNIITLEDPIEYLFKPKKSVIMQRQLGDDMISFAAGLRHALRQDPNVIMVGEMRDLETIGTTITLAETGHLVLATLHTYDAPQTIDRIIDTFPPHQQNQIRTQLSSILIAVISQRLLPKVDGGRVAAREIMINTSAVANLIREGKIAQLKSAIETGSREGMISFDHDIQRLVNEGLVKREAAKTQMNNPDLLK